MCDTKINQSLKFRRAWRSSVERFPDWGLTGWCGGVEECVWGYGIPFCSRGISIFWQFLRGSKGPQVRQGDTELMKEDVRI